MKYFKWIFGLPLVLGSIISLIGLANAQMIGPGMMGGGNYGMMGGYVAGLAPEKQAAVQKLYNEYYAATAQLRHQLYVKHSDLNVQIYGETNDEKKIQVLTKEISDLNAKLLEAQVKLRKQLAKEGIPAGGGYDMNGMMGGYGVMMGGYGGMMGY